MIKFSNIILFTFITLFSGGCFTIKYDAKGGVSIPPHIQTFSVQLFDNRARLVEPTFSQRFTDELKVYIENNTSLRLINGIGDADFSGQITTYEITPQAISAGEQSELTRFSIAVKVEYKDQKQPEQDFEKTISAFRDFPSSSAFNSVEEELSQQIMEEIVELVFNAAFVNW